MERTGYPLKVLHGYEPPIAQLHGDAEVDREQDQAQMSALTGTLGAAAVAGAAGEPGARASS